MAKARIVRLKRERTSDAVYQILRDNILERRFAPGERLDIKVLAQKLDVSITPVKEAVNRLNTEGYVVIRPRSGTFVTEISPTDVAEIFDIRRALECVAAESLIDHATDTDIQKFREVVEQMDKPVRTDTDRVHHEANNAEFHDMIIRLSHNRKLQDLYHGLVGYIQIARIPSTGAHWRERISVEQKEHWAILDAMEKRNRDKLVDALDKHIRRAGSTLVSEIRASQEQA